MLQLSHLRGDTKVTYKEERTSFSEIRGKVRAKAGNAGNTDGEHESTQKKYSMVDVAAEMYMTGHAPQIPTFVYLAKDDNVKKFDPSQNDRR